MYSEKEKAILQERLDKAHISYSYLELAKISVAEIMSAIKVAPSYKEVITKDDGTQIIKYINERDYYGNRPYLNQNAIYLFLYLHFLFPSSDGAVCFSVKETADILSLPEKTIRLNLKVLAKRQYISYFYENGLCFANINSYTSLYNTASASGRGYFMMSFAMFKDLLGSGRARSINELRLQLRGIISCVPGLNNKKTDNFSIKDLKRLFPEYVSLKNLKLMFMSDSIGKFFHVFISHGLLYQLVTKKQYNPLEIKKEKISACDTDVRALVKELQKNKIYKVKQFKFSEKDYSDISKISLTLPICDILTGIKTLFDNYHAGEVRSIGSLVRVLSDEAHTLRLSFSG